MKEDKLSKNQNIKNVVMFGTGYIAQVAFFYFTNDSPYKIVAFTVHEDYIKEKEMFGLPVVPFEDIESTYPPDEYDMFIAVSYKNTNKFRAKMYNEAKSKGYKLVSYICTKSVYWGDAEIGDNCFILENQTIQPFVKIGNNVTLWSGNHIGHHSVIGDHCFITSHVVVSGLCKIGSYSFLGVNCTLRDGITIARDCIIGAGAVIMKDTKEKGVYLGKAAELYSKNSSQLDF
jgi:sugar O-acyltransferase (sialic acid O-acetyltransferase NeuD family)